MCFNLFKHVDNKEEIKECCTKNANKLLILKGQIALHRIRKDNLKKGSL